MRVLLFLHLEIRFTRSEW